MARLAVAPHGFGRTSLRLQKPEQTLDLDTKEIPETEVSSIKTTQTGFTELREDKETQKDINLQCEETRQIKKEKQLTAENTRLSATVSQLQETIQKYEMEMESLRKENENLKESRNVAHAQPQKDFDTRLTEIEQAVAHGLTHTLNALHGIRSGRLPPAQKPSNIVNHFPHGSSVNSFGERLAITAGHIENLQEPPNVCPGKNGNTIKQVNPGRSNNSQSDKTARDCEKEVRVKVEERGVNLPHKYDPGSSNGLTNSSKTKECTEDFGEITFFQKPPISSNTRNHSRLNDKLRRSLRVKQEPETVCVKPEPIETTETRSFKPKVKREYVDENSCVKVKEEPTKRRKALAPVPRNNNSRASSAGTSAKKLDHHAFDFVEKPTLLEQSRSVLKKSST